MFKTLSTKLAGAQAMVFFALGVGFILATEQMFEGQRLLELATDLGIGVVVFSLLAALLVFNFLTRRLRVLAVAVDRFRDSGFTQPIHLTSANPKGDDIDRLGAAVQEMSERIAEQLDLLGQTDVRRRELLANVSHDLRTPLASMQGYLETLLLKHGTLSPEEERSYLEVAAKHSERLGRLIRDLFQLTKLEAHELKPQREAFPVAELVQDVVQKFQLAANKRRPATLKPPRYSACAGVRGYRDDRKRAGESHRECHAPHRGRRGRPSRGRATGQGARGCARRRHWSRHSE